MWDNIFDSHMSGLLQIGSRPAKSPEACAPVRRSNTVLWLQLVTLSWMFIECGASLWAAATAHSTAMLAFGSDSLVELLSATVVLLQFGTSISERTAGRIAGALLFLLALIVAAPLALSSLRRKGAF